MRQFYETYNKHKFVSPLVTQISWTNHLLILSKTKTENEREFYIRLCVKEKYSKRELERQIDSGLFERAMLSKKKERQEFVKDKAGEKYNSFLRKMASLTILLDKIDDDAERWLLLSAPHIDEYQEATFFIEYLTKFEDKESIERIGRIFKKVLENTTPEFMLENIERIVSKIYDKGSREDAEYICNAYGRRGMDFLKPVWEKNQTKKAKN